MDRLLLSPPNLATHADLLRGSREGWRQGQDGRRARSHLDPTRLVAQFRRVGAQWNRIHHPDRGWLTVHREVLLPLLWLALAEHGWVIDRKAAIDAWDLASITPTQEGGIDDPL